MPSTLRRPAEITSITWKGWKTQEHLRPTRSSPWERNKTYQSLRTFLWARAQTLHLRASVIVSHLRFRHWHVHQIPSQRTQSASVTHRRYNHSFHNWFIVLTYFSDIITSRLLSINSSRWNTNRRLTGTLEQIICDAIRNSLGVHGTISSLQIVNKRPYSRNLFSFSRAESMGMNIASPLSSHWKRSLSPVQGMSTRTCQSPGGTSGPGIDVKLFP